MARTMEGRLMLHLRSGNVTVEHRYLRSEEDINRVANATMLTHRGTHYAFAGMSYTGTGRCPILIFTECGGPVSVDGFIDHDEDL